MSEGPYREPGPVEPEPKPTPRERLVTWWAANCKEVITWAKAVSVVLLAVGACLLLVVKVQQEAAADRARAAAETAALEAKKKADAEAARAKAAAEGEQRKAEEAARLAAIKAFADARAGRQHGAEAWMQKNGIEGHATCYSDVPRCDIVPKDARAPFKINCRAENGVCGLE